MFGYIVEITGREGDMIIGNVYDVGQYAEHAQYIQDTAFPLHSYSLTYSDEWGENAGKTIVVTCKEYLDDYDHLMRNSGTVINVGYNPANENKLMERLESEQNQRNKYPIGIPAVYIDKLESKLAKKDVDVNQNKTLGAKLLAATQKVKAQDAKTNPSVTVTNKKQPVFQE